MIKRTHRFKKDKKDTRLAIKVVTFFLMISFIVLLGAKDNAHAQELDQDASSRLANDMLFDDESWAGPILFHQPSGEPIHLILVEKAIQKLFLYRYDGRYHLLQSYNCSTGEKRGKKRAEKDEKTPEGIYFNTSAYRDSKITIFGDRAFGLNYPDVYDDIAGNTGSGIFIHGSNKNLEPFASNGCIVMDNADLADLDGRIDFRKTPIIVGEHLPYRWSSAAKEIPALVPFLKQALLPDQYHSADYEFRHITVIKYQERIVAFGEIGIDAAGSRTGFSRLYLIQPVQNFLVMLKREWSEF
jgi:hypothetical protein